jgi:biotin operon repressor
VQVHSPTQQAAAEGIRGRLPREGTMATGTSGMFTAAKLAEKIGASPAMVKKLIDTLKIAPVEVKGACKYYGEAALKKVQAALKK